MRQAARASTFAKQKSKSVEEMEQEAKSEERKSSSLSDLYASSAKAQHQVSPLRNKDVGSRNDSSQIHRRRLFAKSRTLGMSKTDSLR